MSDKEKIIIDLEVFWCTRMTKLYEENKKEDVNYLFSEFVVDDNDPFLNYKNNTQWIFVQYA